MKPLLIACGFAFLSGSVFGSWEAQLTPGSCQTTAQELSEFKLLAATPEFSEFAKAPGIQRSRAEAKLLEAVSLWSSDLLVKVALQLDQELRVACAPNLPGFHGPTLRAVRVAYLRKLGLVSLKGATDGLVESVFKATIATAEEITPIRKRLVALKLRRMPPLQQLLVKLFGQAAEYSGVLWLGEGVPPKAVAEAWIQEVCSGFSTANDDCPFWDTRMIYKVLVTRRPGIAAYIPEVATLVYSAELFERPSLLHKVVAFHELAHLSERRAMTLFRKEWMKEYAVLSGWKKNDAGEWATSTTKSTLVWSDELHKLSVGAAGGFSLLPDEILFPTPVPNGAKGEAWDGFVFQKGYTESLRQNDPAEDFADHVAAYKYAPNRFCYLGRAVAPRKWQWVAKNLFASEVLLNCSEPTR